MRLAVFWPFLTGPLIAAAVLNATIGLGHRRIALGRDASATSFATTTAMRLALLIGMVAAIALVVGRSQSYSFARLSTFFVPLLVLLSIGASSWVLGYPLGRRSDLALRLLLPGASLAGVLLLWQVTTDWGGKIYTATANAILFATGRDSLAEAYSHADSPYSFGGINPGALAVARQVPAGTPIWSTNIESFCMAPGYLIESVVSFKMSGRLDEILAGEPELAKRQLHELGLDYFLFMSNVRLLDLLPYSRLFAPETIGRYLGIKWNDGSTFLLT